MVPGASFYCTRSRVLDCSCSMTWYRQLLEAFVAAARIGDLASLEQLLAEDVISFSDGRNPHAAALGG